MKLIFVVNEKSGNGKGAKTWMKLKANLTIPYEAFVTSHEKEAIAFAQQIKQRTQGEQEKTLVIGIGGDGTYHELLNGLYEASNVIVGAVCAGSGNDFKRGFTAFEHAHEIEAFIKTNGALQQDLGEINTNDATIYFVNNSGIGFDATVAIAANESKVKGTFNKLGLGKLCYVYYLIKCLFTFKPFTVQVTNNGQTAIYEKVWFLTASNQKYFGGGMNISPKSNTSDGLLELTIVHNLNKYKLLFIFGTVFFGKHTGFKEIKQLSGSDFTVCLQETYLMHADGEKLVIDTKNEPIHFKIANQKWLLAKK
jgi:diacylglycerol kinase (ATP)